MGALYQIGPLLLSAWLGILAGYIAFRILAAPRLAASRTVRALAAVTEAGVGEALPEEAPPPAWAGGTARLALAAGGMLIGGLAFGPGPMALLLSAAGWAGPALYLSWSRKREAARIEEDLPDLLASLSANARLTADLAALLEGAARDLEARDPGRPLARMLRRTAARIRAQGAEAALSALEAESPSPALAGLAFRLRLYARLGGAFADILEESARRQRRRLEGVARAAAKAAGATGLANMLAGMGAAAALLLALLDPQARAFYTSAVGQIALAALLGMMALGRFVIADMVEDVR
jgi:Flp pilus assembly protein TadB